MATGKGTVGSLLVEMRADLGKLRMDVKDMEGVFKTSFTNIQAQATNFGRTLASSLGIGLSVGSVVAFANSVIQLGSRLKDLSVQTGFSVQTLSGIKSVLEENGSSLEAFATGIFRLQKELGTIKNATDPTAQAIQALGLNLKELQNADTDKFLELVTAALAKQENPITRNSLAFQFMGRQARELVPALLEMAGKLDEFRRQGLTEADVKILDDFADGWTRIVNQFKLAAATEISGVLREFTKDLQALVPLLDKLGLSSMPAFLQSFTSLTGGIRNTELELLRLYEAVLKIIRAAPLLMEFLSFGKLDFNSKMWSDMIKGLENFQAELKSPSSHTPVETGTKAPFVAPMATPKVDEIKKLAESLAEANDKLEEQLIELLHGAKAAEDWALAQKEAAEAAKGMSAELLQQQERRRALTEQLREEKLARDDLHRLVEQSRKDTPFIEESTHFGLTPEEQKEFAENENKINEALKSSREEWTKLQQQMAIGLISDDKQRQIAELIVQFTELAKKLQEVGEAANRPKAEIDQMITDAWEPILRQIKKVDLRPAKTAADQLGEDLANSLTTGIRNTLLGVETGQQTLSEGMKNLFRNMLLELQFTLLDKTIFEPLKAIAAGFISGLVGALDEAANDQLRNWAKGLGASLRTWLSEAFSGLGGGIFGAAASGMTFSMGGAGFAAAPLTGMQYGGMLPSFAGGGLFIGHGGEYVLQKTAVDSLGSSRLDEINRSGKLPSGGGATQVIVNGDIIPRTPTMRPEDVIRIVSKDIHDDGLTAGVIKMRVLKNSGS